MIIGRRREKKTFKIEKYTPNQKIGNKAGQKGSVE